MKRSTTRRAPAGVHATSGTASTCARHGCSGGIEKARALRKRTELNKQTAADGLATLRGTLERALARHCRAFGVGEEDEAVMRRHLAKADRSLLRQAMLSECTCSGGGGQVVYATVLNQLRSGGLPDEVAAFTGAFQLRQCPDCPRRYVDHAATAEAMRRTREVEASDGRQRQEEGGANK